MADCHPDRKHSGKGLCKRCYLQYWRANNPEKLRAIDRAYRERNRERDRDRARKFREENPEKQRAINRVTYLKTRDKRFAYQAEWKKRKRSQILIVCHRYGAPEIEAERVLSILACEICGSDDNLGIDHNHRTGVFRGRLCSHCNSAVGLMKDSSVLCQKASEYLERYSYTEHQSPYPPRLDLRTVEHRNNYLGPNGRRKVVK